MLILTVVFSLVTACGFGLVNGCSSCRMHVTALPFHPFKVLKTLRTHQSMKGLLPTSLMCTTLSKCRSRTLHLIIVLEDGFSINMEVSTQLDTTKFLQPRVGCFETYHLSCPFVTALSVWVQYLLVQISTGHLTEWY
jgi:hypothetical protein